MAETVDTFSFDKAVNTRKNPSILAEGELQACSGFSFKNDGYLVPLFSKVPVVHTQLGTIRNIHRYINWVVVQEGSNIKYKWDLDKYCDQYTPANENFTQVAVTEAGRCRVTDYKTWVFIVNKFRNLAFTKGQVYSWGVPNPTVKPGGAVGASGNPNGDYQLYYTFLIKFPNGEQYETAPSPAGTITGLVSQKIEWNSIGKSAYQGSGVIIYRKLYRYSATLGEIYYVHEIQDNTTTTYSDDYGDSDINTNPILSTTDYGTPPDDILAVETYLQRIFAIKDNYLWWSEAYSPFAVKVTNAIAVSDEGDSLRGVISWGDNLYLPTKSRWYRLAGGDPDTWVIKNVFADAGIINPDTIAKSKYGIIGLSWNGINIFDGSTSKSLTEKKIGTTLFTDTISDLDACWSEFDGNLYSFYYPTSGSTPNSCLVIDFTFYPDVRVYNDPFILTAQEFHEPTGIRYMAYNGYQYTEGSSSGTAFNLSLQTGEKVGSNILQQKNLKYLYYDIDTGNLDVTATIYVDDVAQSLTFTLNTPSRKRDRQELPNFEGYRISIKLDCTGITQSAHPIIYAPWAIQSTLVGV